MPNLMEKVRVWIDGENDLSAADQVLEDSMNAGRNKSKSELFLSELLKEIEAVLRDEITRIPSTQKAYIPPKFAVFISTEDEKTLPKEKREFFEQSLNALIMERSREMAGQLQLSAKSIQIEIRVNGTLEKGEIEVKAFDQKLDKTLEMSLRQSIDWKETLPDGKTFDEKETLIDKKAFNVLGTIEDTDFNPLYRLEVFQSGKLLNTFPVITPEISIGRREQDSDANIQIESDNRKISRIHAGIERKANGEIWVTGLHQNPTFVSGKPINNGQKAKLERNGEIQIYEFILRLTTF